MLKNLILTLLLLSTLGCSMFGAKTTEELKYTVIEKEGNIEIRKYESYIAAEVTVENPSENSAFRILAGYIFGGNKVKNKIAVTAPVMTEEKSESKKIAMTAPVLTENSGKNKMTMRFSMPSEYKMEDLPEPNDKRIKLVRIKEHLAAAIQFSGNRNDEKNKFYANELKNWLQKRTDYQESSDYYFAGYNPPWTISFLRRNEALVQLEKNQ